MSNVIKSILSILSGRISTTIIGFLFTPILVRILSQEEYGLYATILAGFSVLALTSKMGLLDAIRKTVAESSNNSNEQSEIVSIALGLSSFYSIIFITFIFTSLFFGIIPRRYTQYVFILLSSLFFINVLNVIQGAFHGIQKEHITALLQTIQRALYAGIGLLLAHLGLKLKGVFTGYTLSFAITSAIGSVIIIKHFDLHLPRFQNLKPRVKELITYGGTQMIGGISAMLLYKTDILLVKYYEGSTATALYNSAIVPAEYVWFIPSAIQMAFLQQTATLWADGEIEEINTLVENGLKYSILSLTLFGVGLFGLAEPFLQFYFGGSFLQASVPLRLLLIGTYFFGLSRILISVLQAAGWVKYTEMTTVFVLFTNILLNILLIPRFGIIGAAIATSSSYVIMFIGVLIIWNYSVFKFIPLSSFRKIVLAQFIFSFSFLFLVSAVKIPHRLSIFVFPFVGFLLFISINGLFRTLDIKTIIETFE